MRGRSTAPAPGSPRPLRADGSEKAFTAMAAVETGLGCELLAFGGVIPMILRRTLAQSNRRPGCANAVVPALLAAVSRW